MSVSLDTTVNKYTRNISKSSDVSVKEIQFGKGYKQSEFDGINYELESWDMDFLDQAINDAIALEVKLNNSKNGDVNILSWTPTGESEKYWEASNIKRFPSIGIKWKVTCTLTRKYILV